MTNDKSNTESTKIVGKRVKFNEASIDAIDLYMERSGLSFDDVINASVTALHETQSYHQRNIFGRLIKEKYAEFLDAAKDEDRDLMIDKQLELDNLKEQPSI